jgi:hypothetical protein
LRSHWSRDRKRAAAFALLGALIGACTYDFDRYVAPAGGGAPGNASGRAGAATAGGRAGRNGAGAGGSTAGRAGSTASGATGGANGATGGTTGADGGESGANTGEGGMGEAAGTGGGARGGAGGTSQGGAGAGGQSGSSAAGAGTSGVAGNAPSDCSDGTTFGGHCYFLASTAGGLDWASAQAACEAKGSHLVTITSAEEQSMLATTFFPATDDAWIGLSLEDIASDPSALCQVLPDTCPFLWVTGEALAYDAWAVRSGDDEPNYTGACARMLAADQAWADADCTSPYRAICENDG